VVKTRGICETEIDEFVREAMTTREDCLRLDAEDPLAAMREEFVLPPGTIYLDGNSLGALPRVSLAQAQRTVDRDWGVGLIDSWNDAGWYEMPRRVGNRLAKLIGADDGEVVVTDTISVNLFKLLAAALRFMASASPERNVIVSERDNFPADLYIVEGLIELLGGRHGLRLVDAPDQLGDALSTDVAAVLLTEVDYRSGYLHDMREVTRQVKDAGALMIWDLAHSAGALPIDLTASGADGAVGCTYKYLNAGPGAPGFVWVPRRNQARFRQPLSGWWSHRTPFAMCAEYVPADGIAQYLCGTPPVVSLALVESALSVFERVSMRAVREKSIALTSLFIDLAESRCAGFGLRLASPRDSARRGSQVSFRHENAYALKQALIQHRVIGDFREPDILRFGFTPLYLRFVDVWDAVEELRQVLTTEEWKRREFSVRQAVT
jgi:kynureninase